MNWILAIPALAWLIVSAIAYAFAEYFSKKFALQPSWKFAAIVALIYAIDGLLWLPAILQKQDLSIAGTMWAVLSLVATVAIGVIFFGEKLSTLGIIGIGLAFISVVILSFA